MRVGNHGRRAATEAEAPPATPARAAVQPALSGLTPDEPEQVDPLPEPQPEDPPAPPQHGPALFAWNEADATPSAGGRSGAGRRFAEEEPAATHEGRRWYAFGAVAVAVVLAVLVGFIAARGGSDQAIPGPTAQHTPTGASTGETTDAGNTQSASPDASAEPTASPSPSGPVIVRLEDASVTVLPGWQLYADEEVQDDRRLIRLRQLTTDTRIQIVTLTSISGSLETACSDLMAEQSRTYGNVAESPTVAVAVAAGAEGVACSFTGTRTTDGVAIKIDFTLVRRTSDAVSIVFRDTIPVSVPADSPARTELALIECGAAETFGVAIDQCATPGRADG